MVVKGNFYTLTHKKSCIASLTDDMVLMRTQISNIQA
jgi:hypothetical protein